MSKKTAMRRGARSRLQVACAGAALGGCLGTALCPPAHAAPTAAVAPQQKAPAALRARPAPATQLPLFALDVYNTSLVYTVTLNGFPVDDSPGDANGHFSSTRCGQYVADGQNTVSIQLAAPSCAGSSHVKPVLDTFKVVIRATGGQRPFAYDWAPEDPKHPLPVQAEGHFTAHLPHGPWAWQSAPKITLDAPTKAAINAHVKRLFNALDTKNVQESTALFAPRNHDYYLARGLSIEEADTECRADWAKTLAEPGWHLFPLDYATLRYTLVAGGRAVHVQRPDGGYALVDMVADANGLHTGYDLILCLVHGQWTLIR